MAFKETLALPVALLGPVDDCALSLLAANWAAVDKVRRLLNKDGQMKKAEQHDGCPAL